MTHRATRPPAPPLCRLTLCLLTLCLLTPAAARGADKPLYQQTPFDLLRVKGNDREYKCYPLSLNNRYKIEIPRTGSLKLQLVDPEAAGADAGEVLIPWRAVDSITVFETLVLQEADSLTRKDEFDAAFPYYTYLESRYPQTPNLDASIHSYLFQSAIDLFKQGRLAEAYSSLDELYGRKPDYRASQSATVVTGLSSVTDKLLEQYVVGGDIDSARRMLQSLQRKFGTQLASVAKWTAELDRRAAAKRDQALQQMRQGRLREAYLTSIEMMQIWPDVQGGLELARETARRYPIARVAVTARAVDHSPRQIDNWAGRRLSRLKHRLLVEYVEPGPSGGIYESPFGKVAQSDDLSAVYFQLRRPQEGRQDSLTAFDLAGELLDRARPESDRYSASWASLLAGVEVRDPYDLTIQFRRSNVLPEAYLQVPLEGPAAKFGDAGYEKKQEDEVQSQYVLKDGYAFRGGTQPAEVLEILYEHTSDAVSDLRRGKIDVIERLHPADAARLIEEKPLNVTVQRYAEPTIHLLVPKLDHPYLARESFRRALVYAIPRQKILDALLLEDLPMDGAQVLDATFSRDSYAYDESVPTMPFDASLGKLMTLVAGNELEQIAEQKKEDPPPLETLVLGHPATKIGRTVCMAIESQMNSLGVPMERKEFPPGVVRDDAGECDLVFAEVLAPEPIVDAERLLSSHGLAKSPSPYIGMAIRRLNRAQDWKEVSSRLHDLHRVSMQNVALIPLWQVPEHFAYREGVHGVSGGVLSLYQNIEQWQIEPLIQR